MPYIINLIKKLLLLLIPIISLGACSSNSDNTPSHIEYKVLNNASEHNLVLKATNEVLAPGETSKSAYATLSNIAIEYKWQIENAPEQDWETHIHTFVEGLENTVKIDCELESIQRLYMVTNTDQSQDLYIFNFGLTVLKPGKSTDLCRQYSSQLNLSYSWNKDGSDPQMLINRLDYLIINLMDLDQNYTDLTKRNYDLITKYIWLQRVSYDWYYWYKTDGTYYFSNDGETWEPRSNWAVSGNYMYEGNNINEYQGFGIIRSLNDEEFVTFLPNSREDRHIPFKLVE